MQFARGFIDLHHKLPQTIKVSNDFKLTVDDGNGNIAINQDLANNNNSNWANLTSQDIKDWKILPGYASRDFAHLGGVDTKINTRLARRVSYVIMGRDPNNNDIISPTEFMLNPTGKDQLVIDIDFNGDAFGNFQGFVFPIIGGIFCDNNGIPKKVTIDGISRSVFGASYDSGKFTLALSRLVTYPSNPINRTITFDNIVNFDETFNRRRYIIDRDSKLVAQIQNNSNQDLVGPFELSEDLINALFNNNLLPTHYSQNEGSVGALVDLDWDIFYRNRSDA